MVWFRKTVDIPASMAGRHAKIRMGRMVDGDEVFVNGVSAGSKHFIGPIEYGFAEVTDLTFVAGDVIKVAFDPSRIHLFDKDTEHYIIH